MKHQNIYREFHYESYFYSAHLKTFRLSSLTQNFLPPEL